MPSPKQLDLDTYTWLKTHATTPFTPFESAMLDDRFRAIEHFQPPPTYNDWLAATDVKGKLFGTKSRGDRLQAVDRAYKAWIEYAGPEGIMHWRNAENLANALEKYSGVVYNMGNQVSGLSRDYRNERDNNMVMSKTRSLCRLLQRLCVDSPVSNAAKRRMDRRALLTLIANIKVEWSATSTVLLGLLGMGGSAHSLLSKSGLEENIIQIFQDKVVTYSSIGVGVVGTGVGTGVAVYKRESIQEKVAALLQEKWADFKEWMIKIFRNHFGLETASDLLEKAAKAFALVAAFALKEVAKFASGGADIYAGLRSLISDAWTRTALSLQQAELVTSEGAFALIRKGIDVGIRNRQVVAAWTIAKGVNTTVMAATASAAAGSIASLVLGAFQMIFKIVYNYIEVKRINSFIDEARMMWAKVSKAARSEPAEPVTVPEDLVPKMTTGYMPAFKATYYTAAEFLDDGKAAYLNFLHSLVESSPVMAAVVMNSDAFKSVHDVMHAATPRSTDDDVRAADHIKSLKIQAKRLYKESGFKILPNTVQLDDGDQRIFNARLNAALFVTPA
ncbi:hypothetical protein HH212_17220 [Massilia forsythiae]|uniref:Uncharacterized protein n=1 Tax=Massilia forsythiae TaxID=2728020 RepID=A0A7Z2VY20_9BURK|nr:hypothetical protein [Massilia forsythiae]QJE01553.1 hypothetical protein HH212_17220 [Massilia forsythiae]